MKSNDVSPEAFGWGKALPRISLCCPLWPKLGQFYGQICTGHALRQAARRSGPARKVETAKHSVSNAQEFGHKDPNS